MKNFSALVIFLVTVVGLVFLVTKTGRVDPSLQVTQATKTYVIQVQPQAPVPVARQVPIRLQPQAPVPVARQVPIRSAAQTESDIKIINHEQDNQADRCKNGYSDGCNQERAIADFKKAIGQ